MADSKTAYSTRSIFYKYFQRITSPADRKRYNDSRNRRALHNSNWLKQKVNLNDFVDNFTPGARPRKVRMKVEWTGEKYKVVADMPSGYVRLFSRNGKIPMNINGEIEYDGDLTHFKILKRKEM